MVTLTGTADCWAKGGTEQHECVGALEGAPDGRRRVLTKVKEAGAQLVIADMAGTPLADLIDPKTALVLGNEGQGVSPVLKEMRDATITVPGDASKMESLNVAYGATLLRVRYFASLAYTEGSIRHLTPWLPKTSYRSGRSRREECPR